MTTTVAPNPRINERDRLSLILTVAITLLALAAGLLLRGSVESRTRAYSSPAGVTIQYPDGWRLQTADAAEGTVRARETTAQGFATTLEVQTLVVDTSLGDDVALSMMANQAALTRAANLPAFKLFEVNTGLTFKGLPGATASYVFVNTGGSALQEEMPVVVLGDDVMVRKGGTVYLFSVHSTEANHARALAQLKAFVDSAQLP